MSRYATRKVIPAALAVFLLAGGQQAFAYEIDVVNDLKIELTNGTVENRQDVDIKKDPPKTIAPGATGTFDVQSGDSIKTPHLKVRYQVGSGSDAIDFGFNNDSCYENTPPDILGSHEDCKHHEGPVIYTFSPNLPN